MIIYVVVAGSEKTENGGVLLESMFIYENILCVCTVREIQSNDDFFRCSACSCVVNNGTNICQRNRNKALFGNSKNEKKGNRKKAYLTK